MARWYAPPAMSGTSIGHGPVKILFLEPDFVPSASALDVGHESGCWPWPCQDSFLGRDFVSSANDTM